MISETSAPLLRCMIYIHGEVFDPASLSKLLNISPTETGIVGEKRPNGKSTNKETYWKLSKDIYDYSVNDAATYFLSEILLVRDKLNKYVMENNLEVCLICNVTIKEERPVYVLERDLIKTIASINAEFLMDIFDYSE